MVSIKKRVMAIAAGVLVAAVALTGTYAWNDYRQHKSNEVNGGKLNYEAKLIEDFQEKYDWKIDDGNVKKEIRVKNSGTSEKGFGSIYVRLQLKEYMEICEITYIETDMRYMIDTAGNYVSFATEKEAQNAYPGHEVKELTEYVSGTKGWYVQTKEHDPNGQMGQYVLLDVVIGAPVAVIPGSTRAVNVNHHGTTITDANGTKIATESDECNYPIHTWNGSLLETREFIEWQLNDGAIIKLSEWDGNPIAAWLIDDLSDSGWIYWGQELKTQEVTADFLKSIHLIKQPDGNFYYVIHTELEAVSLDELKVNSNWNQNIRNAFINNASIISFDTAPTSTLTIGQTVAAPSLTVGPQGAQQSPLSWTSSNSAAATVDANGNITGVAAGSTVITVTAPNGASASYTVNVVSAAVTGVSINGSHNYSMNAGDAYTPGVTFSPAGSTGTAYWSSDASGIASVNANGVITANASGSAVITVTVNGKTDTMVINVSSTSTPPVENKGTSATGRIVPAAVAGDSCDWIEVATNGGYSLVVRSEVTSVSIFGSTTAYDGSAVQAALTGWLSSNLSTTMKLNAIVSDASTKTGSNFGAYDERGCSKPGTGSDKIFLISGQESGLFCGTGAVATNDAKTNWALLNDGGSTLWWTRTSAADNIYVTLSNGSSMRMPIDSAGVSIRPAMWVNSGIVQ
jgi:uncharacterized protein YjdB